MAEVMKVKQRDDLRREPRLLRRGRSGQHYQSEGRMHGVHFALFELLSYNGLDCSLCCEIVSLSYDFENALIPSFSFPSTLICFS